MSFFYLSPVKGELPMHMLEVILINRLEHLKKIFKGEPAIYNEYVVEGSIYDNVGHFMLCIITILSKNIEFVQFFLKAELEQFKLRLASLAAYEMRFFSKKLLRTIKKIENVPKSIDSLQILCQHLMLKNVAQHVCSISCNNSCTAYTISMKFTKCLSLVARRQVDLKDGQAIIPCGRWKQFLLILFQDNLRNRIYKTSLEPLKSDSRIITLLNRVTTEFSVVKVNTNILLSKDVNSASIYFPPCMLNLHQSLRNKHRLSHSQRFHYSLFLKDIGMPVEEAIEFWRAEYRLHPNGHHSCSHNWEKDEKKYLYGIRHMYGLEGCRKKYTSVSCKRIQSIDNASSEGGCPFKSFDNSKMLSILGNCTEMLPQINELKRKHLYSRACMVFMQNSHLKTNECDTSCSFNFTPVKYYMTAAKVTKDL